MICVNCSSNNSIDNNLKKFEIIVDTTICVICYSNNNNNNDNIKDNNLDEVKKLITDIYSGGIIIDTNTNVDRCIYSDISYRANDNIEGKLPDDAYNGIYKYIKNNVK